MTSSGTGQSPNVDATHSLWSMSVPPAESPLSLLVNEAACLGRKCVQRILKDAVKRSEHTLSTLRSKVRGEAASISTAYSYRFTSSPTPRCIYLSQL